MKQNLNYFQTFTHIDLRNGRFQGFMNEKQQRHGFGIVLDDDLTLYLSEWQQDLLNGITLIVRIDGTVLFGQCKHNSLQNTIMFKNNQFTILSRFKEGKPYGLTAAFDKNTANALIFNANELTTKKKQYKTFCNRFTPIKEIRKQKEIILKIAKDNNIQIDILELQFLQFLRQYYKKYQKYLDFIKKQVGGYYFGFKHGIGFQFSLTGNVHQKIQILSMGVYGKLKILEDGIKVHKKRCYEEGRFNIKQTISYRNLLERPQKSKQILQTIHKQSLNYISKYFYLKSNYLDIFDQFIYRRLQDQFRRAVSRSHQQRKLSFLQKSPNKQSKIELQVNQKKITKNHSFHDLTYRKCMQASQKSKNNARHLNDKELKKQKSQQKKKSLTKSASFVRNKSHTGKSKKQLYINNYKIIRPNSETNQQFKKIPSQRQIIKQSASPKKQSLSPSKNQINLTKVKLQNRMQKIDNQQKDSDKSIARLNQQKIRQELYQNEQNQKYHLIQRSTNQINLYNYNKEQIYNSTSNKICKSLLASKSKKEIKIENKVNGRDFMKQFQLIEKRRKKILTDYKNLNLNSLQQTSYGNPKQSLFTQINEFTLIQPPFSHKDYKINQQQKYSDKFISRYFPQSKYQAN